jgi:hypothetical protein
MPFESDKVMFEIYREPYQGLYRVVYFTELQDHNKETEINRAMAIGRILDRLNDGEKLTPAEIRQELEPFIPA